MGAQASVQMHLAVDAFADDDDKVAAARPDMDDVRKVPDRLPVAPR
jgi:hypothetical protein